MFINVPRVTSIHTLDCSLLEDKQVHIDQNQMSFLARHDVPLFRIPLFGLSEELVYGPEDFKVIAESPYGFHVVKSGPLLIGYRMSFLGFSATVLLIDANEKTHHELLIVNAEGSGQKLDDFLPLSALPHLREYTQGGYNNGYLFHELFVPTTYSHAICTLLRTILRGEQELIDMQYLEQQLDGFRHAIANRNTKREAPLSLDELQLMNQQLIHKIRFNLDLCEDKLEYIYADEQDALYPLDEIIKDLCRLKYGVLDLHRTSYVIRNDIGQRSSSDFNFTDKTQYKKHWKLTAFDVASMMQHASSDDALYYQTIMNHFRQLIDAYESNLKRIGEDEELVLDELNVYLDACDWVLFTDMDLYTQELMDKKQQGFVYVLDNTRNSEPSTRSSSNATIDQMAEFGFIHAMSADQEDENLSETSFSTQLTW